MISQKKLYTLISICSIAVTLVGCACTEMPGPFASKSDSHHSDIAAVETNNRTGTTMAIAYVKPVKGNKVNGKVIFTKVGNGVRIVADFDGLTPGKHGFHVHEHGDCGGDDASAAGAHFNPTDEVHAGPDAMHRHIGDLGNLTADENGRAHYERIDNKITLEGKNSIVGRSVIVHADPDDYKSQPAGASGAKIACGIIEAAVVQ